VSAISAGIGFSLAVSAGRVYSFGNNGYGQLGNGTRTDDGVPSAIAGLSGVASVAAGNLHAVALLEPGVAAPPALVSATPGSGSIKLRWTVAAPEYGLRWKPAGAAAFGPVVKLTESCSAAHPCGYAIGGLSAEPYEVDFFTYVSEGVRLRRFLTTPKS
jgi:hypothetical protein